MNSSFRNPGATTIQINKEVHCPCCSQPVTTPSLDMVIEAYRITPMEAAILGVVWAAKGRTVSTQRIFCAMYADDPDGGPGQNKMYDAFKVALCHMRKKLDGSGIGILNLGHSKGYRLVIEGQSS
jgi:DNA-binding response OmpR family regulator